MGIYSEEMIRAFESLPTGNICDANQKSGFVGSGISPINALEQSVAGPAYTVKCKPGDNLAIHHALLKAQEGSVLVVDVEEFCQAGHFGGMLARACQKRGIKALVINGSVRDRVDIGELGFPVFAKAIHGNGTTKYDQGKHNVTVTLGGVAIREGDLVIGDGDGVVVVAQENCAGLLERAQAIFDKEIDVVKQIAQGMTTLEIYGFERTK